MCNLEVRKKIAKKFENSLLFDYPYNDNSIIGITKDSNVVYDYESMIEELAVDFANGKEITDDMLEMADDYICYNTLGVLTKNENQPIVVCTDVDDDGNEIICDIDERKPRLICL